MCPKLELNAESLPPQLSKMSVIRHAIQSCEYTQTLEAKTGSENSHENFRGEALRQCHRQAVSMNYVIKIHIFTCIKDTKTKIQKSKNKN